MTAPPPRRPWWKRKRTWLALAVWLPLAYPVTFGMATYAQGRGWAPQGTRRAFEWPARQLIFRTGLRHTPVYYYWMAWEDWCQELARGRRM